MVYPWATHGPLLEPRRLPMGSPWDAHGMPMGCQWATNGMPIGNLITTAVVAHG